MCRSFCIDDVEGEKKRKRKEKLSLFPLSLYFLPAAVSPATFPVFQKSDCYACSGAAATVLSVKLIESMRIEGRVRYKGKVVTNVFTHSSVHDDDDILLSLSSVYCFFHSPSAPLTRVAIGVIKDLGNIMRCKKNF